MPITHPGIFCPVVIGIKPQAITRHGFHHKPHRDVREKNMSRSVIETVLGAIVLIGAFVFLVFSYSKGDAGEVTGYRITADFSGIGGLKIGDDVQISGVKIGQVAGIMLDPQSYLARVTMEIDNNIKLPDDSSATISSQSLLGGKYMALEPGASEDILKDGGRIEFTQAPQNLEEILGKFIFSAADKKNGDAAEESAEAPAPEAVAPQPAPALAPVVTAPKAEEKADEKTNEILAPEEPESESSSEPAPEPASEKAE